MYVHPCVRMCVCKVSRGSASVTLSGMVGGQVILFTKRCQCGGALVWWGGEFSPRTVPWVEGLPMRDECEVVFTTRGKESWGRLGCATKLTNSPEITTYYLGAMGNRWKEHWAGGGALLAWGPEL